MVFPIYERVSLGTTLRAMRAGGLIFTESMHAPHSELAAHGHQRAHLCLVLQGRMREGCGRREVDVGPGELVWKYAGREHWNRFGPQGCRSLAVEIEPGRMERLVEAGLRPPELNVLAIAAETGSPARQIQRAFLDREVICPITLEALALQLLTSLGFPDSARHFRKIAWLERVQGMLSAPGALAEGLAGLASRVGVHPVHLARTFRARFGCTIGDYVRKRKIDSARQLLAETDHSIARIAIETGFADQAHLTRLFRRATGTTPAAFRRQQRLHSPR
jgi:AraC family transcriptional regulator